MSIHLSQGASGAIRRFAGWVARGSVGHPTLKGIDYWDGADVESWEVELY